MSSPAIGPGAFPFAMSYPFLRSTPVGSVTVFSPSNPNGPTISHTTESAATSGAGVAEINKRKCQSCMGNQSAECGKWEILTGGGGVQQRRR
jgi:hypothetical protein